VFSLSVLVPVYNQRDQVTRTLVGLQTLVASPRLERLQVIVVDDCSSDSTPEALQDFERSGGSDQKIEWLFLRQPAHWGKGRAVRTAIARATESVSLICEPNLDLAPSDLLRLATTVFDENADAAFGSRSAENPGHLAWRSRALTALTRWATHLDLGSVAHCCKAVRTDLLRSIPLVSDDARIETELAIKLVKRGARIVEFSVNAGARFPPSTFKTEILGLAAGARFAVTDALFTADEGGSHTLNRLSRAPRFNAWMGDFIRPYCGRRVLEIGAGIGNLTRELIPRDVYVASDINPSYIDSLRRLVTGHPYLRVSLTDVTRLDTFPEVNGGFDTVICLNVIEHVEDDRTALANIHRVLAKGGRAIVLVPQGPQALGTLDEALGHKRRYTERSLRRLAADTGFKVDEVLPFNHAGWPAWWLNGKILRRRTFGLPQVLALNLFTPLFRCIDQHLPFPPLSLVGVLAKP